MSAPDKSVPDTTRAASAAATDVGLRRASNEDANARQHPWRNVVTRALTGGEDPDIDTTPLVVQPADRLLLCTDALSGVIAPELLKAIVGKSAPLEETCRALIDAANAAGGPDNITVVLLEIEANHVLSAH